MMISEPLIYESNFSQLLMTSRSADMKVYLYWDELEGDYRISTTEESSSLIAVMHDEGVEFQRSGLTLTWKQIEQLHKTLQNVNACLYLGEESITMQAEITLQMNMYPDCDIGTLVDEIGGIYGWREPETIGVE